MDSGLPITLGCARLCSLAQTEQLRLRSPSQRCRATRGCAALGTAMPDAARLTSFDLRMPLDQAGDDVARRNDPIYWICPSTDRAFAEMNVTNRMGCVRIVRNQNDLIYRIIGEFICPVVPADPMCLRGYNSHGLAFMVIVGGVRIRMKSPAVAAGRHLTGPRA
jgi:hypothetical protein